MRTINTFFFATNQLAQKITNAFGISLSPAEWNHNYQV